MTTDADRTLYAGRIQRAVEFAPSLVMVTVAYVIAGRIGLSLGAIHHSVSAVWPATGIALATALLLGPRVLPGIMIGGFIVSMMAAGHVLASAMIATGNMLEAAIAAQLITTYARGRHVFDRAGDSFRFVLFVALAASVSAAIGCTTLVLTNLASERMVPLIAFAWWLGDFTGGLLIAPVIIAWSTEHAPWNAEKKLEFVLLLATAIAGTLLLFGGLTPLSRTHYPLVYVVIPTVVWGATRLGRRGATTVILAVSCVAVAGSVSEFGPLARLNWATSLLRLQGLLAELTTIALPLAAGISQRIRAETALRKSRAGLERKVAARTESLSCAVAALRQEVAERERTERRLLKSEALLREAQRAGRIGSWEWDIANDRILLSDESYRLFGRVPDPMEQTYPTMIGWIHPADREMVERAVSESVRTLQPFAIDHRIALTDGSVHWLQARGTVTADASGNAVRMVGTEIDITERRRAERRFHGLLEAAPDAVVLTERSGAIVYVNHRAARLFGYPRAQLLGRSIDTLLVDAVDYVRHADGWDGEISGAIQPQHAARELRGRHRDGTEFPVELTLSPVDVAERPIVSVSIRDVSERKRAEDALHKSLAEKDVLLKEIHHRVKNNLQITTSLLNLQAARLTDAASCAALAESADRVRSMALVHETLHEARDLARIHFGEYARKVVEGLVQSYVAEPANIGVRFAIVDIWLGIDNAIHCGLLLNELVSNSLKHAFAGREHGEISIAMAPDATGKLVLEVRDDGVGLPRDLDFRTAGSLGLRLVTILTTQLGGVIELDRTGGGTTFRIAFTPARDGPRVPYARTPGTRGG